jgi:hypothetical protein
MRGEVVTSARRIRNTRVVERNDNQHTNEAQTTRTNHKRSCHLQGHSPEPAAFGAAKALRGEWPFRFQLSQTTKRTVENQRTEQSKATGLSLNQTLRSTRGRKSNDRLDWHNRDKSLFVWNPCHHGWHAASPVAAQQLIQHACITCRVKQSQDP